MKLTPAQRRALEKYADGAAHNETDLRIRGNVYDNLCRKGLIRRVYFLKSRITDAGRAAIAKLEDGE